MYLFLCLCVCPLPTGDHNNKEKHFTDREVCRPFLLGICINDLFINTVRDCFLLPCRLKLLCTLLSPFKSSILLAFCVEQF